MINNLTAGYKTPWANFVANSKNLTAGYKTPWANFVANSKNLKGGLFAMKKKGISAIVATVLIILITVAAVTIIWAAIIPMINNQLDRGIVCLDAVQQITLKEGGYTCIKDSDTISIQIKHGSEDIDLADIQILFSANGTTTSYDLVGTDGRVAADLPGANEERAYDITVSGANNVSSVSIAPVVSVGNTEETCDVSATVALRAC